MMIKKIFTWGALCIITLNCSLSISWADVGKIPKSTWDQPVLEADSGKRPQEPTDKLTLNNVLELALAYNSELSAAAWEVRAKEGAVLQAGLLPNPELSIDEENFGGSGDLAGFDGAETTIGLSQLIELGGKRTKRRLAASLEKEFAQFDLESKRLDVIAKATKAFFNVLVAQKRLKQAREFTTLSESIFNSVVKRVNTGKVSSVAQTRSSVELSAARLAETKSQQELAGARRALAANWNGLYPRFKTVVGDLETVSEFPSLKNLATLVEQNPDLVRWGTAINQRRAERELAGSMAIPDVTVGLGVRTYQDNSNNTFSLNMTVPLPVFNRNQGKRAEAEARLRKAQFEKEAARMENRSNLTEVFQRLSSAQAEVTVLSVETIPSAQAVFEAVSTGYREGKFGYLEFLDAQRTLFGVKEQYQTALVTYHWARADMERLIGQPLNTINLELIKTQRGEIR